MPGGSENDLLISGATRRYNGNNSVRLSSITEHNGVKIFFYQCCMYLLRPHLMLLTLFNMFCCITFKNCFQPQTLLFSFKETQLAVNFCAFCRSPLKMARESCQHFLGLLCPAAYPCLVLSSSSAWDSLWVRQVCWRAWLCSSLPMQ